MPNTSYQTYHRKLLQQLAEQIKITPPFNGDEVDELQANFLEKLDKVQDSDTSAAEQLDLGQWLLSQLVGNYQHLMPSVPRALFWYFGGDCMHYLGDEEITHFQTLEERYHELLAAGEEDAEYEQLVLLVEQEEKGRLH